MLNVLKDLSNSNGEVEDPRWDSDGLSTQESALKVIDSVASEPCSSGECRDNVSDSKDDGVRVSTREVLRHLQLDVSAEEWGRIVVAMSSALKDHNSRLTNARINGKGKGSVVFQDMRRLTVLHYMMCY